jgi:hypothetical protein
MKMTRLSFLVLVLFVMACGKSANNGDGGSGSNNAGTNSMSMNDQCQTDDDCPAASDATFARPDEVICADGFMGKYCSECVNDQQCEKGEACRDATYCEVLPPCEIGQDCADSAASEVHQACIDRTCDFCIDDADCEDDEVCYSRLCATRDTVDATCIDASCEGACDIQYDDDGAATGVSCL